MESIVDKYELCTLSLTLAGKQCINWGMVCMKLFVDKHSLNNIIK